jgi:hypothetical protein
MFYCLHYNIHMWWNFGLLWVALLIKNKWDVNLNYMRDTSFDIRFRIVGLAVVLFLFNYIFYFYI